MSKIGIIGGSGVYKFKEFQLIEEQVVETPFGETSDKVLTFELDGNQFYFIPRHGRGHFLTPTEVNYRANIYALKKLGVSHVLSVTAVGSLKEELPPTTIFLPDQYIDWTKGLRERTFFGDSAAGHVSVAHPIEKNLQQRIYDCAHKAGVDAKKDGSYVCIEGPQFSSKAESHIYRSFGCSVIGMTNVPESYLAKEAGMAYATMAMVTDYDCWREGDHVSVDEVMRTMALNYDSVIKILKELIPSLSKDLPSYEPENKNVIMTNPELISEKQKEILEVILS